jgi:hypothetical protein
VNYYVKLEEGQPPAEYYKDYSKINSRESLEQFIKEHRAKHMPYHQEKDPFFY